MKLANSFNKTAYLIGGKCFISLVGMDFTASLANWQKGKGGCSGIWTLV